MDYLLIYFEEDNSTIIIYSKSNNLKFIDEKFVEVSYPEKTFKGEIKLKGSKFECEKEADKMQELTDTSRLDHSLEKNKKRKENREDADSDSELAQDQKKRKKNNQKQTENQKLEKALQSYYTLYAMSDDDETSPDKENNCVCSKENLKKFLEKEFAKMTDHFDKKLEKMTEHFDQKFEKMTDNYSELLKRKNLTKPVSETKTEELIYYDGSIEHDLLAINASADNKFITGVMNILFSKEQMANSYIHDHGSKSKKQNLDEKKVKILYEAAIKKFLNFDERDNKKKVNKLLIKVKEIAKNKCCDALKKLKKDQMEKQLLGLNDQSIQLDSDNSYDD